MGGSASQPEGGAATGKGYDQLEVIQRSDPAWKEVEELLVERQKKYSRHYRNQEMKISKLWRIKSQPGFRESSAGIEELGPPLRLFHGTDVKSAEKIVEAGFHIPAHPGMFGRGIYFARCPLKSEMYSRGAGIGGAGWAVQNGFRRMFRGRDEPAFTSRVMLLCDVFLGNSKTERCLGNVYCGCYEHISTAEEIKPTMLDWVFCPHQCCCYCRPGGFQSVYAPGGKNMCINTVWVSEYVVYDPDQATPLYLMEFETEDAKPGPVGGAVRVQDAAGTPLKANGRSVELRQGAR